MRIWNLEMADLSCNITSTFEPTKLFCFLARWPSPPTNRIFTYLYMAAACWVAGPTAKCFGYFSFFFLPLLSSSNHDKNNWKQNISLNHPGKETHSLHIWVINTCTKILITPHPLLLFYFFIVIWTNFKIQCTKYKKIN